MTSEIKHEKMLEDTVGFFQRNVSVRMLYTRTLVASIDQDTKIQAA